MKNIPSKAALHILSALILLTTCNFCNAQDTTQNSKLSVRAPKNIKIDGKLTEWNGKLKQYSNHTQFYYAVSNDDQYLYLTVQAKYNEIANRILKGGITLTISKSDTRKDPNSIRITYPVINLFRIRFGDAPKVKRGDTAAKAKLDTFVNEQNAKLDSRTKFIRVAGIKGVDSLISIYNLDGIKAASAIDKQLFLNYELAVSLGDLGLDIKNPQKFTYQVMINEAEEYHSHPDKPKSNEIYVDVVLPGQLATDFWGEYILAK